MSPEDPRHGTNAGHRAHISDKSPICQPCREAHNAYRRGLWRKKYLLRCDSLYIDSTGTIRRIRALQALGWRLTDLDHALGHGDGRARGGPNYAHNLTRQAQVHRDTAAKVARVYERLSMQIGPSDRSRALARKYGWPPPLAWDDHDIDDPAATPCGIGYISPNRAEALRDLASLGVGITEACARLHLSREALEKWAARHGMSDVYRELAGRETPIREYRNQFSEGAA